MSNYDDLRRRVGEWFLRDPPGEADPLIRDLWRAVEKRERTLDAAICGWIADQPASFVPVTRKELAETFPGYEPAAIQAKHGPLYRQRKP